MHRYCFSTARSLQTLQLAADHAGVFGGAQGVKLPRHPSQPCPLEYRTLGKQFSSLGLGLLKMLLMKLTAGNRHSLLALKVNSPLRHLAALAVTAFKVLLKPASSCSVAANTSMTV